MVFQSFVALALHCAELITTLSRDEETWRKTCTTSRRHYSHPNALFRAALSWEAVVLFVLKIVLHWLISTGFKYQYDWGIFMQPPALLYLSIGATVLAVFATYISFRRRKGEQPVAFGHLQTLVDLVDEWHSTMYWGDKGPNRLHERGLHEEVRHAGTSSEPLGGIRKDSLYCG